MNFDRESILFDVSVQQHPPMSEGLWIWPSIIEGDISHSSIAGTVKDVPDARIITPTDLVEVCIMVDFICFCFTSYATN